MTKEGSTRNHVVSREAVARASRHNRLFQVALAILANHYAHVDICGECFRPMPVFKAEGGVLVGTSEVVPFFDRGRVVARATRIPRQSTDTAAVEAAAYVLLSGVEWSGTHAIVWERLALLLHGITGMAKDKVERMIDNFVANPFDNPLTLLFSDV